MLHASSWLLNEAKIFFLCGQAPHFWNLWNTWRGKSNSTKCFTEAISHLWKGRTLFVWGCFILIDFLLLGCFCQSIYQLDVAICSINWLIISSQHNDFDNWPVNVSTLQLFCQITGSYLSFRFVGFFVLIHLTEFKLVSVGPAFCMTAESDLCACRTLQ